MSDIDPGSSAVDIIKALKAMPPDRAAAYLTANYNKIKPAELTKVISWARNVDSSSTDSETADKIAKLNDAAEVASRYQSFHSDPANMTTAADKAAADIVAGKKPNLDFDGDGVTSPAEQAALQTSLAANVTGTQSANPTVNPNVIAAATDKKAKDAGAVPAIPKTPQWMLTQFTNEPGFNGDLSDVQKQRVVDQWNTAYGTSFTWDKLVGDPAFNDPTSEVRSIVGNAFLADTPTIKYAVSLPGNRSVPLTADDTHKGFINGVPLADAMKTVRLADAFGMTASDGTVAWQPLAALMKANGLAAGQDPKLAALQAQVALYQTEVNTRHTKGPLNQPRQISGTVGEDNPIPVDVNQSMRVDPKPLLAKAQQDLADYLKANPDAVKSQTQDNVLPIPGISFGNAPGLGVAKIATNYQAGLDKYGDPAMAYIHALDPGLAARLFASGGDETKVSNQDIIQAGNLMNKGGWDPTVMAAQGYGSADTLKDFMDRLLAKGNAAKKAALDAQGPVQNFTDPTAIKENVRTLWNHLFGVDPSQTVMDTMSAEYHKMEASAPLADASKGVNGVNIDPTSEIQQMIQGSAMYKKYYGNKGGLADDVYHQQFLSGAGSILGAQADNNSVLTGMAQGNYGTTVGAAAVTGIDTSNSTFLGNLANAAQVVNNMT